MDKSVAVSEAELLVLETYLGKQLDALFGGGHPSRNESVMPDEAENSLIASLLANRAP